MAFAPEVASPVGFTCNASPASAKASKLPRQARWGMVFDLSVIHEALQMSVDTISVTERFSTGTAAELAICGGRPAFREPLHVGRPNIGNRAAFKKRVNDILDRRWLTNDGRYVKEFEQSIAKVAGTRHAIAMCNGTVALEIVARALNLSGEVIVPSFTFVATANALQWQGITPVFADITPGTYSIDPDSVEQMITPKTTGIVGVHIWGQGCDVGALEGIARRHNLKLLFDAAHAFGCSYRGKMIGGFGNAEVFSFHATKCINSLEGGAIVTNDDELNERIRLMKNFGFVHLDETDHIGVNGKMNEMCAAMGITNVESMPQFIDANFRNFAAYEEALAPISGLKLFQYDPNERSTYNYVVVDVNSDVCGLSRDDLFRILRAENVLARRYFYPGCHRLQPYRSHFPHAAMLLPETERVAKRVLCLPTGETVTIADVKQICRILSLAMEHAAEVKARLEELTTQEYPKAAKCHSHKIIH